MNSSQKTRTNRDQEKLVQRSKAGISPTTQAGAEQAAAVNRAEGNESSGPMTQPGDDEAKDGVQRRHAAQASHRGDSLPSERPVVRSPKQENL